MSWTTPVGLDECGTLEPLVLDHAPDRDEAAADDELWTLWYTSVPIPEGLVAAIEERLAKRAPAIWLRSRSG